MEQLIQSQLVTAALQLERQLDSEIDKLDNLGTEDIEELREHRLKEMKKLAEKKQEWKANVCTYNLFIIQFVIFLNSILDINIF